MGGPSAALADGILIVPNDLATAESPGSILVAFSDKGATTVFNQTASVFSFDNQTFQIAVVLILGFTAIFVVYKLLKSRKVTLKQLLIYGGISLVLIVAGLFIYRYYSRLQWTGTQTQLINEGKIDPATGSFIEDDGSPKHIEYQGRKYFLDGLYCAKSNLDRFPAQVKRVNGAVGADGGDGNMMYAIGAKDNPEYIDNSKVSDAKKDCWKRETK